MAEGYYKSSRAEMVGLVPNDAVRVLEIGCAAGCFRENFSTEVEYWGVEPVEKAADEARKKNIKVLCGIYDDVRGQLPNGYFDAIVCNDVVEHIPDSETLLASLKEKLSPRGVIVGSVPNVRFWRNMANLFLKRDWKYESFGVLDKTHLRFFTFKSFRRLVEGAGFYVDVLSGIESPRMKVLKVLFSPLLCLVGFDVCNMQIKFRISRVDPNQR